jgi:hypothetical protein
MKTRHLILAIGVAISTGLAIFGDKTPAGGIAEATARNTPLATPLPRHEVTPAARLLKNETLIMALVPRDTLIGGAQSEKPAEGLFNSQSWTPPPPPPPKVEPVAPTAPPLPFTYIGKKQEGNAWEIYLAHDQQTLIVHEHDQIEGIYRVDSVKPPTLTLTYLPLQQVQTLTIGGEE